MQVGVRTRTLARSLARWLARWSVGFVLVAAGALLLVLFLHADRAGAAELPAGVVGVVPVVDAADAVVVPVVDAADAPPLGLPPPAPVDLSAVPVVGDLLAPGTLPGPLPVVLPPPVGVVTPPGLDPAPTGPASVTDAGSPAVAHPSGVAPSVRAPAPDAWWSTAAGPDSAVATSIPSGDGPAVPGGPPALSPLGVLTAVAGASSAPWSVLVAVLVGLAWACARGPGRRVLVVVAGPAGGVVTPFERPG